MDTLFDISLEGWNYCRVLLFYFTPIDIYIYIYIYIYILLCGKLLMRES